LSWWVMCCSRLYSPANLQREGRCKRSLGSILTRICNKATSPHLEFWSNLIKSSLR
jgi:hypothetical protein